MNKEFQWTDKTVAQFINQYDTLRGYNKAFNVKASMEYFKEKGSLVLANEPKPITVIKPNVIKKKIAFHYNVPPDSLTTKGRRKGNVILPKQVFQYFLKNLTALSLTDIGKMCGYERKGSGHDTVFSNINTIQNRVDTEPDFRAEIADLKLKLK